MRKFALYLAKTLALCVALGFCFGIGALVAQTTVVTSFTAPLIGALGGTGVANSGKTITLGGNLVTGGALTLSGAHSLTATFGGDITLALGTAGTKTFPDGSKTLLATDLSNIGSGVLPVANIASSPASHAVPVDVAGASTYKVIPDCTDAGGNHINYTQSSDAFSCGTTSSGGAGGIPVTPQGRLTLTTGTPVMTADATAQTTVYYDCQVGNNVPVAGNNLTITSCEISMGLDAGVPHIASGSVYDIFAVNNSGSPALCAGPAWSSTTSRGTGAGTTELQRDSYGFWANKNSLTHCWGGASGTTDFGTVSANSGTYLGSFYATANGQTGMQFSPTPASGGTNNVVALYNAYNRVAFRSMAKDSTSSWTYNANTWRSANNSNSNRITWLDGLSQSQVNASYVCNTQMASGAFGPECGINFDSTSATPGGLVSDLGPQGTNTTWNRQHHGEDFTTALGLHYAQAMEKVRSGTATFFTNQTVYWGLLSLQMMD